MISTTEAVHAASVFLFNSRKEDCPNVNIMHLPLIANPSHCDQFPSNIVLLFEHAPIKLDISILPRQVCRRHRRKFTFIEKEETT